MSVLDVRNESAFPVLWKKAFLSVISSRSFYCVAVSLLLYFSPPVADRCKSVRPLICRLFGAMAGTVKNVAIFGSTGMTGLATLPQAVAAGMVRNSFKRHLYVLCMDLVVFGSYQV